jgi:hypothetical protein
MTAYSSIAKFGLAEFGGNPGFNKVHENIQIHKSIPLKAENKNKLYLPILEYVDDPVNCESIVTVNYAPESVISGGLLSVRVEFPPEYDIQGFFYQREIMTYKAMQTILLLSNKGTDVISTGLRFVDDGFTNFNLDDNLPFYNSLKSIFMSRAVSMINSNCTIEP